MTFSPPVLKARFAVEVERFLCDTYYHQPHPSAPWTKYTGQSISHLIQKLRENGWSGSTRYFDDLLIDAGFKILYGKNDRGNKGYFCSKGEQQ